MHGLLTTVGTYVHSLPCSSPEDGLAVGAQAPGGYSISQRAEHRVLLPGLALSGTHCFCRARLAPEMRARNQAGAQDFSCGRGNHTTWTDSSIPTALCSSEVTEEDSRTGKGGTGAFPGQEARVGTRLPGAQVGAMGRLPAVG